MMNRAILITAGQGPAECQWVVKQVWLRFKKDLEKRIVAFKQLEVIEGDERGCVKSILLEVEDSTCLRSLLKSWEGTILWVGSSVYRPKHKRRNWYISLKMIERVWEEHDISDVKVDVMRASGPGGQHVNKTQSAVRITHNPTGISVISQDSRSQHANRKKAKDRLESKLNKANDLQQDTQKRKHFLQHYQVERGNPVRVYRGPKFKLSE